MSPKLLISFMIAMCSLALAGCFGGADTGTGEGSETGSGGGAGSGMGTGEGEPGDPEVGMSSSGDPGDPPEIPPMESDDPGTDPEKPPKDGEVPGDKGGEPDLPRECDLECDAGTYCVLERNCKKEGSDGFIPVPCEVEPEPACVPNPPCGGKSGTDFIPGDILECAGVGECVDDPRDDCNPELNEACASLCVCEAREDCPEGSRFDDSPKVCDCVKREKDGGEPPLPPKDGGDGDKCGDTVCGDGTFCCNPECGICAPVGFIGGDFCKEITCG